MKSLRIKLSTILLSFFLITGIANAALQELPDSEGKGYFLDLSTGYTWMDLDNFYNMSFAEVVTLVNSTEFSIATHEQVEQLFDSIGSITPTVFNDLKGIIGDNTRQLTNDGQGINEHDLYWAYYDDGNTNDGVSYYFLYDFFTYWYGGENSTADQVKDPKLGAFVVRPVGSPVPVPSSILLLCTGLLGIAGITRKKK